MGFVERIKSFFEKDEVKLSPFQMSEDHYLYEEYIKYFTIVDTYLMKRDTMDSDKFMQAVCTNVEIFDYYVPQYYLNMFWDITKASDFTINLKDVIDYDRQASGHVDYLHKFALYLAEEEHERKREND